jgi:hypothetical protein
VHTITRNSSGKVQLVSILSMTRAERKDGSQIYATDIEVQEDGVGTHVPLDRIELLGDFANRKSDELSKVLPPRHNIYHRIELSPRL